MYKLVALDIDGTLLNADREISDRVKKTIYDVRKKGVKVILSSGRGYMGVKRFVEELELEELVLCLNGAAVSDASGEELVFSENVDPNVCKKVIEFCEEHNIYTILFVGKDAYVNERNHKAEFFELHDRIKVNAVGKLSRFYNGHPTGKLLMHDEYENLKKLRDRIENELKEKINVTFSLPYFLEAYSPKTSKGLMLSKVAEYYGIKREEVIAMGDGENDLSMIEYAGMGIAMGNAVDIVKQKANFITKPNTEDGVAYALEKFILSAV